MVDHVDASKRASIMSAIRGKDTKPEMLVRRAAHALGLRFRLHDRRLPGRPDLVFARWRTVVFVHGCFWHRHPGCRKTGMPKSNVDFWTRKFEDNVRRDASNQAALEHLGWRVVVLWECQVRSPQAALEAVAEAFSTTPSVGHVGQHGGPANPQPRRRRSQSRVCEGT